MDHYYDDVNTTLLSVYVNMLESHHDIPVSTIKAILDKYPDEVKTEFMSNRDECRNSASISRYVELATLLG